VTTPAFAYLTQTSAGDRTGGILVALGAILFGCVVFLAKLLSRGDLSVPMALSIRFGICSVLLVGLVFVLRLGKVPARGERVGILLGVGLYSLEATLFFAALHHGEAATVTLLFFTYPVFTLLVLLALGQGLPGKLVVGATVAVVVGAGLVAGSSGGVSIQPIGILFVLGSAAGYTAYVLVIHRSLRNTNSLTASMWVTGGVALTLFIVAAVFNEIRGPAGASEWAELAGMGTGTAAGIVCLFMGLRRIGPVRTSILSTMEPLSVAGLSFAVLGEPILPGTAVGGLLILGGAAIAARVNSVPAVQIQ
jgi:drug/metabolite transporter (DMT)-like permease